jgi:DNA mismatch repair protein MutH
MISRLLAEVAPVDPLQMKFGQSNARIPYIGTQTTETGMPWDDSWVALFCLCALSWCLVQCSTSSPLRNRSAGRPVFFTKKQERL